MALSSAQKILISVTSIVVVLLLFAFIFFSRDPGLPKQTIELSVWSPSETSTGLPELLNDFTTYYKQFEGFENVSVRVQYKHIPEAQYETVLLNALAEGRGPDVFFIHNTWLPRYQHKLTPMPEGFMTVDAFQETFVPVAADDLILGNAIYAMPMYVDSLALYYNVDQYQDARTNLTRPQPTWAGLLTDASVLRIVNSDEDLLRGGIALGTAQSITYAPDIFAALLKQYGGDVCDDTCTAVSINENTAGSQASEKALTLYQSFQYPTSETGSWNDELIAKNRYESDIDAFVNGSVAAIIGYEEIYPTLKERSQQNKVKVQITELPQVDDPRITESRDTLAKYWAPAVSSASSNTFVSWQLLGYLTSRDSLSKYHTASGKPTSRQDLIALHQTEPETGIFATQSKYASSLHVYDIDQLRIDIRAMLESVASGEERPRDSLQKLENAVQASLTAKQFLDTLPSKTVTNAP